MSGCERALDLIGLRLDGPLSPEEQRELDAHLEQCPACRAAARELENLPPIAVYEPDYVPAPPEIDTSGEVRIVHEDDTWIVDGPWLQRLMANVNFGDYESRNWFDRMLRESGLFDRLEAMGIQDGDTVSLYNLEFEYRR